MEGWLESLPALALDRWWSYYQLEPWDVPREFWPDAAGKARGRGDAGTRRRDGLLSPQESLVQLRERFGG